MYKVDHQLLQQLDELECHPTWYLRTPTQCLITKSHSSEVADREVVNCEVYIKKDMDQQLLRLPHISSYDSSHGKDYVLRQDRAENS